MPPLDSGASGVSVAGLWHVRPSCELLCDSAFPQPDRGEAIFDLVALPSVICQWILQNGGHEGCL